MSSAGPQDGNLLDRLRKHDPEAFAELDKEFRSSLMHFVRPKIHMRLRALIDAEDVVQDTFLAFATHLPSKLFPLDDHEQLWKILTTIALNKLSKEHRWHFAARRNVSREIHLGLVEGEDRRVKSWEPIDPHPDPTTLISDEEEHSVLTRGLPPREARIVTNRLRGYAVDELHKMTGLSRSTIQRIWNNALARYAAWQMRQEPGGGGG